MSDEVAIIESQKNGSDLDPELNGGDDSQQPRKKQKTEEPVAAFSPDITATVESNGFKTSNGQLKLTINQKYREEFDQLKKLFDCEPHSGDDLPLTDSFLNQNCQIIREPFKVTQLKQFVQDENILTDLMKLISVTRLRRKCNDLYSLKQSRDLATYSEFASVCKFFSTDVRLFLENLTGIKLNQNVALTISKYEQNDYLLCHDDQLDNRKIAFILYLVEKNWSSDDGGQLELFRCDTDDHQPLEVTVRLNPTWNLFNFFVVQPNTYHQVSEIITSKSVRWSINGWFHADDAVVVPRNYQLKPVSSTRLPIEYSNKDDYYLSYRHVKSWINPDYFPDDVVKKVQNYFVRYSEVQLANFLRPDKFRKLATALSSQSIADYWKRNFCPILSKYDYIGEELFASTNCSDATKKTDEASSCGSSDGDHQMPAIVREAYDIFTSEAFFLYLSNLTGVHLHPQFRADNLSKEPQGNQSDSSASSSADATTSNNKRNFATCRCEIRRWQASDYTLASDLAPDYLEESALDVFMFLNVKKLVPPGAVIDISGDEEGEEEVIEIKNQKDNKNKLKANNQVDDEKLQENQEKSIEPRPGPSKEVVSSSKTKSEVEVIDLCDNDTAPETEVIDLENEDIDDYEELNDEDEEDYGTSDDNDDDEEEDEVMEEDEAKENEMRNKRGGFVSYIDEKVKIDLLTVEPADNMLNLVFRLKGTQRFMKRISSMNNKVPFNEMAFVYYQPKK